MGSHLSSFSILIYCCLHIDSLLLALLATVRKFKNIEFLSVPRYGVSVVVVKVYFYLFLDCYFLILINWI
jgi:hypothetical protein